MGAGSAESGVGEGWPRAGLVTAQIGSGRRGHGEEGRAKLPVRSRFALDSAVFQGFTERRPTATSVNIE